MSKPNRQAGPTPYPGYARLRDQAPVLRLDPVAPWLVTRHAEVLQVLRDPQTFSSTAMRDPRSNAETLIGSDPPVHTRLRKIVNRAFTPARIAALEARIQALATELVDGFAERGSCELVRELAAPLPVTIIAEILGVDASRREGFKRWSDDALANLAPFAGPKPDPAASASLDEMSEWVHAIIAARRAEPRDDLISALVAAEADEAVMTDREVRNLTRLLLVAGNETTTHLIGNAVLALLEHPRALNALRNDPTLVSAAVEETLRYDTPVQVVLRRAACDAELAGTPIAAGDTLALLLGSANRDERRFAEPDRFDLRREGSGHLAFGWGTHFCLGARLARNEAGAALGALLARADKLELAGDGVDRIASPMFRGPRELRLRFQPRCSP